MMPSTRETSNTAASCGRTEPRVSRSAEAPQPASPTQSTGIMDVLFHHPANVCMTYSEHMWFSLSLAMDLFRASAASLVHAFVPDVLVHFTSNMVRECDRRIKQAGCRSKDND